MRLIDLARLARDELVSMAEDGRLKGPNVWTALKGGGRYLAAVATGDAALEAVQRFRADVCRTCEHAKDRAVFVNGEPVIAWYCGEPFEDRGEGEPCGCLVGISVDGEPLQHAAGKAVLDSEECPRGKW